MILEEKDGLRILKPKSSRYIIHIKATDTYHEKVYLGNNATLDEFEEVDKLTLEQYDKNEVLLQEQMEISNEQDRLIIELVTELAILKLER